MTGKTFLDTNIIVYAADNDSPNKQHRARTVLTQLSGKAVVSTQVLQEFFVAATRKLGIDPLKAKDVVHAAKDSFEVVTITCELIDRAIDQSVLLQISFWDALILAAAESAACTTLLTEDLNQGQPYTGITVENPFQE